VTDASASVVTWKAAEPPVGDSSSVIARSMPLRRIPSEVVSVMVCGRVAGSAANTADMPVVPAAPIAVARSRADAAARRPRFRDPNARSPR
jgi:hypothetical protein